MTILLKTFAFLFIFFMTVPFSNADDGTRGGGVASHDLDITVDIQGRKVTGTDTVTLKPGAVELKLYLREGSKVLKIERGGKALSFDSARVPNEKAQTITIKTGTGDGVKLVISFEGEFQSTAEAFEKVKRGVAYLDDGVIGEEGVFLPSSSLWYPQADDGLAPFTMKVSLPRGLRSVSEGELIKASEENGGTVETWRSKEALDGADLVAGRYAVAEEKYKGVAIYTFFFKDDPALSKTYIDKTKEYLDLYGSLIGPYPYKKFAVVESFLPTGYGMPSFTLLGSSVIRLPFIPDTSLGHEIAHNWWGNSVFIDSSEGNWVEALTTYTADYLFEKRKGEKDAIDFRLKKLRGYKNFAEGSPIALKNFQDSTTTASRAVGYNKGLMLFNMLERLLGEEAFSKGLRAFYSSNAGKNASWTDIKKGFEKASDKDLGWFFDEWLNSAGGPVLSIEGAVREKNGEKHILKFSVVQAGEPYVLDLPLLVRTEGGDVWKNIRVKEARTEVSFELASAPASFEIDPEYQTFRILKDEEVPPSIATLLGDKESVMILPNRNKPNEKYTGVSILLAKDYGLDTTSDTEIGVKDFLAASSILILGGPGENSMMWLTGQYLAKHAAVTDDEFRIDGKAYPKKGSVLVLTARNPHIPSKVICFFIADGGKETALGAAKRMRYFSEASWLLFNADGGVHKGVFEHTRALRIEFN
ncbi:MAG: hypothetical protein A2X99_03030 [Deltaproteobacteria bacterium GWB2_55_19]|nr:MAG: hypothetical protein A2X99_03030 [Deltaproteobacteria bacterium GWB2_55_19]